MNVEALLLATTITNSQDVWFIGGSFFGTPNGSAIQVDANSYLHINGGIVGVFFRRFEYGGIKNTCWWCSRRKLMYETSLLVRLNASTMRGRYSITAQTPVKVNSRL